MEDRMKKFSTADVSNDVLSISTAANNGRVNAIAFINISDTPIMEAYLYICINALVGMVADNFNLIDGPGSTMWSRCQTPYKLEDFKANAIYNEGDLFYYDNNIYRFNSSGSTNSISTGLTTSKISIVSNNELLPDDEDQYIVSNSDGSYSWVDIPSDVVLTEDTKSVGTTSTTYTVSGIPSWAVGGILSIYCAGGQTTTAPFIFGAPYPLTAMSYRTSRMGQDSSWYCDVVEFTLTKSGSNLTISRNKTVMKTMSGGGNVSSASQRVIKITFF